MIPVYGGLLDGTAIADDAPTPEDYMLVGVKGGSRDGTFVAVPKDHLPEVVNLRKNKNALQ